MTGSKKLLTVFATAGAMWTAPAGAEPESRPLLAANGRPACGNVVGKGRVSGEARLAMRTEARKTLVERLVWLEAEYPDSKTAIRGSRHRIAQLGDCIAELAQPLLTASGRPACGNVQGKAGPEVKARMLVDERAAIVAVLRSPQQVDTMTAVRRLGEIDGCLAK